MARQRLTADDYADMAFAAEEMAGRSVGIRKEMNKALQVRYRALSERASVAAVAHENSGKLQVNYAA